MGKTTMNPTYLCACYGAGDGAEDIVQHTVEQGSAQEAVAYLRGLLIKHVGDDGKPTQIVRRPDFHNGNPMYKLDLGDRFWLALPMGV